MRIGIYTFTAANNYGAVLQAYALKTALSKLGNEVFCVDYRPTYLWDKYQPFSKIRLKNGNLLKNFFRDIFFFYWLKKKNKGYESFRNKFLSLLPEKDVSMLSMIVVGSDQVWNYKHTHGDEKFLGMIPDFQGCVVSYAASMEGLESANVASFKTALKNFSQISVREISLQKMMRQMFDVDSTLVLDPTLLLERTEWMKVEEPFAFKKPYMLAYIFGITPQKRRELENLAAKKNLELFVFCGEAKFGRNLLDCESPQKFLSIIHNAAYIVTNSFHGTVFSIIYGKRFCVVPKSSNERIETLLELLNVQNAKVSPSKKICYSDFVEVTNSSDLLMQMKKQSISYLKSISSIVV